MLPFNNHAQRLLNTLLICSIAFLLLTIGIWFSPIWLIVKIILSILTGFTSCIMFFMRLKIIKAKKVVDNSLKLFMENIAEKIIVELKQSNEN